jgi:large subunit ribosomal protein L17
MRKKVFGRKLSRNRNSRKALFRSLVRALVLEGKIKTTVPKAKAIRPEIDKIMSLVRDGSLAARRRALSKLGNDRVVVATLFEKYANLTKDRSSGFTRIIALPERKGDNAPMAYIEWVEAPVDKNKKQ